MQKLILSIAAVCLSVFGAQAQIAFTYGSGGQEYGKALAMDEDDNFYVASLYQNRINIDPNGNSMLTSTGGVETVIAKYAPDGSLIWGKSIGGPQSVDVPHGIETDGVQNVYVTGYLGVGDGAPVNIIFEGESFTSEGGFDTYLAKYDADGNYLWALTLGNLGQTTEERAWDLAVSENGNSYIAGASYGTMNFNPRGTEVLDSIGNGEAGIFLAKYDTNGEHLWHHTFDANLADIFSEGYITIDEDEERGRLYAVFNFRNTLDLFGTTYESRGQCDILIAAFDNQNGNLVWSQHIGGAGQDLVTPGAMRLDNNGEIHFTGRYNGTCNFDPNGTFTGTAGSVSDIYLASYSKEDGAMRYVLPFPSRASGLNGGHRVGFDSDNNIFVSGWMRGFVQFSADGDAELRANSSAPNGGDIFVAKYTPDAKLIWAFNAGAAGNQSNSITAGMGIDSEGNVIVTGQFFGANVNFDPLGEEEFLLSSAGMNDCFTAKYTPDGKLFYNPDDGDGDDDDGEEPTALAQEITAKLGLKLYPNPAVERIVLESDFMISEIKIFSLSGKKLLEQEVNARRAELKVGFLPKGVYFLKTAEGGVLRFVK